MILQCSVISYEGVLGPGPTLNVKVIQCAIFLRFVQSPCLSCHLTEMNGKENSHISEDGICFSHKNFHLQWWDRIYINKVNIYF